MSSSLPDPPPPVNLSPRTALSAAQTAVIRALVDAVIPGIVVADTPPPGRLAISPAELDAVLRKLQAYRSMPPTREQLIAFLAEAPADDEVIVDAVRASAESLRPEAAQGVFSVCSLLSSRLGSLLLTGSLTPFHKQTLAQRQAVLAGWQASRFVKLRVLLKAFSTWTQKAYVQRSRVFAHAIGYSDTPPDYVKTPSYAFAFETFPADSDDVVELTTDVVIVGSGPGGGVCAARLAAAGHDVLVVDKARAFSAASFPMPQAAGEHHLFENGGGVVTASSGAAILAGSTWGGGGTVNWGVSLRTPLAVRREWAERDGLPMFISPAYDAAMDAVCDGMHVSTEYPINSRGQDLMDAARTTGHEAAKLPLNSGQNPAHACGRCHLGCGSNSKMGPMASWLPRAAADGARFMDGMHVERVIYADAQSKVAVGIEGTWTARDEEGGYTRKIRVKARRVVVSAGSLWSPVILKKSGITNPMVGQNLHLHPCLSLTASYDTEINPWEGPMMSSIVSSLENLDGAFHGVRIEPCCSIPFLAVTGICWTPSAAHRLNLLHAPSLSPYVVFAREDNPNGYISIDPTSGVPTPHYTPPDSTLAHIMTGLVALARMLYAHGATTIFVGIPGVPAFRRPADDAAAADAQFAAWLAALRKTKVNDPAVPLLTAHQMGTCRMSADACRGVVDPRGRVYGAEALYVADASVLPSASGVNPMVSNMATAWYIAGCIDEDMKADCDAQNSVKKSDGLEP